VPSPALTSKRFPADFAAISPLRPRSIAREALAAPCPGNHPFFCKFTWIQSHSGTLSRIDFPLHPYRVTFNQHFALLHSLSAHGSLTLRRSNV